MRIGIDARALGPHFPGISRATLGLLGGLREVEHGEQIVVFFQPIHTDLLSSTAIGGDLRFTLTPVAVGPLGLGQQWQMLRAARAGNVRLWHAPYYFRPFALPLPVVVTIFDLIGPFGGGDGRASRRDRRARLLWWLAMQLSVRTAAHIITGSEAAARDLRSIFGLAPGALSVVPLGVDARFRPQAPATTAALRAKYGLPVQYLLYVGSNKPHKNVAALIEAWATIVAGRDAVPPDGICLAIAGHEDPRFVGARERAAALGLGTSVRFLPGVPEEDLPALLSGALGFVFPSLHEGFGLPPLEAMACGTPVIASNRPSLPEVVGDAGLLVEPSPPALAAAMARLIEDADLCRDLAARGLARAAHFSWERTAVETLRIYHEVAR